MRFQVFLRDDLAKVLNDLAWRENRWPKQQAEWLLQQALEEIARQQQAQAQAQDAPQADTMATV